MSTPTQEQPPVTTADDLPGLVFASRTLTEHLVRGVVGLLLAAAAFAYAGDHPWALLGLVGTVVAWRGCPTCWAVGLGATLAGRRARCADGTCR
ncbi:hypothetical protein [uncultured Nocardioides sp.]|uniref:hypothetical protein n=1 Tax=uncultured Nocardioides sp. TaxID=198441 RepID=UPI00262865CD|nr:hypothetical protein [uncultured Nocardioides sp.]